ncbi:hypothetical protein M426DRAFT_67161 [Hypoxylon sp. CI-4A]|nr:hypothetical protein M426DRAFT_67161 [Hypoxylon sp. CI-4A]
MQPPKRLYHSAVEDTDEVEDREKYRPGGYHPIHFDDYIDPKKRFKVIHKLGWTLTATQWLCHDRVSRYHRAVKVLTADQSVEGCPEFQAFKLLRGIDRKELEENCISIPHDYFWIDGPNGHHLCFVSDVLGPNLFMNTPDGQGVHTPEYLINLNFQVSKGLQYLHGKGICHGGEIQMFRHKDEDADG